MQTENRRTRDDAPPASNYAAVARPRERALVSDHLGMDADALTGRLLVAAPSLRDPNFERTVVLMLDYSSDGAVGVVLNRPSATAVGDALPAWAYRAAEPHVVFVGGPVSPTSAICLAGSSVSGREGWQPLFGTVGTLDLARDPDEVAVDVAWLRVFAGYAGWGAGQLEGEIAEGAWYVVDAEPLDAVCAHPSTLWRTVLRRQPGPLAAVANFPADLIVN
jgi:putative transcriptional regulator